jgi:hypothetical protein
MDQPVELVLRVKEGEEALADLSGVRNQPPDGLFMAEPL